MRTVIRYFAQRTTLANVITLMIILLGLGALSTIQRDNFPNVDFEEMYVTTHYAGASPEDVELNVTNEIEAKLKEVDGLERVVSYSMENISVIKIQIDRDYADTDRVKADVRDAISRVSKLPEGVDEDPSVFELTSSTGIPIIEVGLAGNVNYAELREAARLFEKKLEDVDGVASLKTYGYLDREIQIEVGADVAQQFQVSSQDIVNAIRLRNVRSTGGSFESYTSGKSIVTLAQFDSPLEVEDVIVRARSGGSVIRVRDVAVIKDAFEPAKVLSRMNGTSAISFIVYKKESADMIRTIEGIKAVITDHQTQLPTGVSIEYSNDKSRIVRNRLEVVALNGVMGLVLVLIVLTLFLNFRAAFWVGMGIPVSLLGTLFLLPVFGVYLDSIGLAAMILVIGIIVDDGIVVAENIWSYQEKGLAPIDAAVEGMSTVFKPVLTTIITTGLAFSPMFFMSGVMGSFVYVIPLVVVLALAVSFLEISVAMPAHLISGAKQIIPSTKQAKVSAFIHVKAVFARMLAVLLRFRYLVVALFVAVLISSFGYAANNLRFVLFPTQSADEIYLTLEFESGASLEFTSEKLQQIEELVMALPEEELDSFVTRIGSHGDFSLGENENWAVLGIYLTPFSTRSRDADQVVDSLRTQLESIPGIVNSKFIIDGGGPPTGRPVTLRIVGGNDNQRVKLVEKVISLLNELEGVKDIDRDDKRGKQQTRIELNYLRLAEQGLSVADISRVVRLAYDGEVVTSVRYGDEDVAFRVWLEASARSSENSLSQLVVRNNQGRFIELGEIARLEIQPAQANFYHYNYDRAVTVTADIVKDMTTPIEVSQSILASLDMQKDWPEMRVLVGGEAEETGKSMSSLIVAALTAAIGIYLVLLLLFNSVFQPLMVMMVIPFGLIGVIFAFVVHQQSMGFLAMLGVIGLTGIVVNDSLILTNLVNHLRKETPQVPFLKLVVLSTQNRLRPILLTSITTVAGLLPMAYGIGGSDPFSAPMALSMGYGILFATPLTLILLPCLLLIQNDFAVLFSRLWHKRSVA